MSLAKILTEKISGVGILYYIINYFSGPFLRHDMENNELISKFAESADISTKLRVLPVAKSMQSFPNMNDIFFDLIRFNYEIGLPFFKIALPSALLTTSNGFPSEQRQYRQTRYPHKRQHFYSYGQYRYPLQTYNYLYGFNKQF